MSFDPGTRAFVCDEEGFLYCEVEPDRWVKVSRFRAPTALSQFEGHTLAALAADVGKLWAVKRHPHHIESYLIDNYHRVAADEWERFRNHEDSVSTRDVRPDGGTLRERTQGVGRGPDWIRNPGGAPVETIGYSHAGQGTNEPAGFTSSPPASYKPGDHWI